MQPNPSSFFLVEGLLKISGKKIPQILHPTILWQLGKKMVVLLFTNNHFTVITIKDIF